MLPLKEEERWIRNTFDLARKSAEQGFEPFGAVLVKNGEIVSYTQDKSKLWFWWIINRF